jgi:predicted nucleic acid-binding protein
MRDEIVLDASVVADWLFPGPRLELTLAFVRPNLRKIAPDLIFAEFISVAAKAVRRGLIAETIAWEAVERLPALIDDVAPLSDLALPAYDLATRHGFSTYDGVYLALALRRDRPLITADAKLARRAVDVGLARHVRLVSLES